jgi:hypothetical protein
MEPEPEMPTDSFSVSSAGVDDSVGALAAGGFLDHTLRSVRMDEAVPPARRSAIGGNSSSSSSHRRPEGPKVVRTRDGVMELTVGPMQDDTSFEVAAVITGTGDKFSLCVSGENRSAICVAGSLGQAPPPKLHKLVSRAVGLAYEVGQQSDATARLACEYSRAEDDDICQVCITSRKEEWDGEITVQDIVVLALARTHQSTTDDKLRIMQEDILREQDVLLHNRKLGELVRAHPSLRGQDHPLRELLAECVRKGEAFPWEIVASAPLSMTARLEFETKGDLLDVSALQHLHTLRKLSIRCTPERSSYDDNVKRFGFHRMREDEQSFAPLSGACTAAPCANGFADISFFSRGFCSMLESISFIDNAAFQDASPFAHLNRLADLTLSGCVNLKDAAPLTGCANLRYVDLSGCTSLSIIPGGTMLMGINLSRCTSVKCLDPLVGSQVWRGSIFARAVAPSPAVLSASKSITIWGKTTNKLTAQEQQSHNKYPYNCPLGFCCRPSGSLANCAACDWPSVDGARVAADNQSCTITEGASSFTVSVPGVTKTVSALSVILIDTNVNRDMLQPLCHWFRSLSEHGAIVCMPEFERCNCGDSVNTYHQSWHPLIGTSKFAKFCQPVPFECVKQCSACEAIRQRGNCNNYQHPPPCCDAHLQWNTAICHSTSRQNFDEAEYYRPKPESHVVLPPLGLGEW